MKIRTRLALVLALSLTLAGSLTLVVNAIAFEHASYETWSSYRDALLEELGVPRANAVAFVRAHPAILFDAPGDTGGQTGKTIDQASKDVQRRAVDQAIARSRRWTVLAIVAVLVGALTVGWVLAGRILRPIRLVTRRARAATATDLDTRVSLDGPHDEMKELADTFDAMLDRLAESFDAQRRFSEQVSHELRTPLAVTRSEVEMLLTDLDEATTRARLETIANATNRADRLVSQLLVLSRTNAADLERSAFAFDELVGNVVGRSVEGTQWSGLRVDLELQPATAVGDRPLLESLVRNLIDNAGRHNHSGGWVSIVVEPSPDGQRATLDISNTTSEDTDRGLDAGPPGRPHIGLLIVAAVLDAHDGTIEWRRRPGSVTAHVELAVTADAASLAPTGVGSLVRDGTM